MKGKAGAFVLMIVLCAAAVLFGAFRGWTMEKQQVLDSRAGLESMLHTRVESAYNLLTVASRHMEKTDPLMLRVLSCRETLESGSVSLPQKAAASEALSRDGRALLEALKLLPDVQSDARDLMYVQDYLPQMLAESEEKTAGAVYNTAAGDFNARLNSAFSGRIARMLGVTPAEEFIAP